MIKRREESNETPLSARYETTQDQPGVELLLWENCPEKHEKTTPDSCELLQRKPIGNLETKRRESERRQQEALRNGLSPLVTHSRSKSDDRETGWLNAKKRDENG